MISGIVDHKQGIETTDRLIFFVFMVSEFIMSKKTGQLSGKIKLIQRRKGTEAVASKCQRKKLTYMQKKKERLWQRLGQILEF